MGEITEALRRAKRERGLRDEKEVCAELVPEESAVVRAGLDSPPPAERVVREPVRIVPAEAAWMALACEGSDGEVPESRWAEIAGPDEPFVRSCP